MLLIIPRTYAMPFAYGTIANIPYRTPNYQLHSVSKMNRPTPGPALLR